MQYLSAAHAFYYTTLRINPDLTSCKDFAMVVDNSLDNKYSACNASYTFYHIDVCMPVIINLCFYHSHACYYIAIFIQIGYKK